MLECSWTAFSIPLSEWINIEPIVILLFSQVFQTEPFNQHLNLKFVLNFVDLPTRVSQHQTKSQILSQEEKTKAAKYEISMMKRTAQLTAKKELEIGGLHIEEAWYGNLSQPEGHKADPPTAIEVTIPLQLMVENSKLEFTSKSPKHLLDGFYDPCFGKTKNLWIRYSYQRKFYSVIVGDCEPFSLPLPGKFLFLLRLIIINSAGI